MRCGIHAVGVLTALLFPLSVRLTAAEDYPEGYATNLKIPLNAPVQDVVNVLDREGVIFTGAFKEQERDAQLTSLRSVLSGAYDRYTQTNKQVASTLFDKVANRLLPTFYYRGEKHFLLPSSFRCLNNAYACQLFEKNPDPYFSQYAVHCENLPPNLKLFGMSDLWVIFTSFEGQPPRSCIVALASSSYPCVGSD